MKKRAVIVGAGVGGLGTAIRLAHAGYAVEVFEASAQPGGKIAEVCQAGYRFDAGPSVFTLPEKVEELFRLVGEDPAEHFQYSRLDPLTQYFWPDGTDFAAPANPQEFVQTASTSFQVSAKALERQLRRSKRLYDVTTPLFLAQSLHTWRTYVSKAAARAAVAFPIGTLFQTMHQANRSLGNPKLTQLFDRYATYNGSDPHQAPATLNVIPHLEYGHGIFLPKGGMYAISTSLKALAERCGVRFHFNCPVDAIVVKEKRATGVRVAGEFISANVVVSNGDVVSTFRHLLPNEKAPEKTLRQPRSLSAIVFYWGIQQQFPALDVHNVFFSTDYATEFRELFLHKTVPNDPTIYVNITSKQETTDAPPGCENWFVMVNAPHDEGQPWDALIAQTRARVQEKLSRMLGVEIAPLIATEGVLEPRVLQQKFDAHQGSIYGTSSNTRMAAFLRHPNFSKRIRGLYFVGTSVHPGGGIPVCLYSAKIASALIRRREGR